DMAISGIVTAADIDNDPLTFSLVGLNGGAHNGVVFFNPNGTFTYRPVLNFNGSDSFSFLAKDGSGNSNTATVSVTVNAVNDAPDVTVPASLSGRAHVALPITGVTFTDIDGGGANETATFASGAGTLSAASAGGVVVTGSGTGMLMLTGSIASLNAF